MVACESEGEAVSPARGQIAAVRWTGEESMRTTVKEAPIPKREQNRAILEACLGEFGAVKMRVGLSCYGPGTVEKPTPRQWWLLGESYSVACRGVAEAEWFVEQLRGWIAGLDGVELVKESVDAS